jgi:hypothetical protein
LREAGRARHERHSRSSESGRARQEGRGQYEVVTARQAGKDLGRIWTRQEHRARRTGSVTQSVRQEGQERSADRAKRWRQAGKGKMR